VGDHAAVGEDLGRFAQCVDERLVQPAVGDDLANLLQERRRYPRQPLAHRADALLLFQGPVIDLVGDGAVPHIHLADQPGQQRADRLPVVVHR